MPGREEVFQKAMNEGHSAAWDQDWKKAATAYRRALQESPDQPKALNSLALALYQLGEFDESLRLYQQVANISPNDPAPFEKIAQISERLGDLNTAVEAAMKAADAFLNQRDVNKAIENWVHVTTLGPDHLMAHTRLAMVHERLGQGKQAVTEYLALASILQRTGKPDKALELVNKCLQLIPENAEAKQAQALLRSGQMLPKPMRPKGGTGPISMAKVKQLEEPTRRTASGMDPVAEARQKALTKLAEVLFDYSDESPAAQERRGLSAIVKGTGQLSLQQAEQAKVVLHLGQAIDAQTKDQEAAAAEELEHALEAGFNHPALYFNLGYLRAKSDRLESAIRNLTHAIKHKDYGLGSRLLLGEVYFKKGQISSAAIEYLEALKLADSMTVSDEQADEIRQLYEPLIESQQNQKDDNTNRRLCENVGKLLMRADWRDQVHHTREQLRRAADSNTLTPLAEVILQAQSSSVIESINRVHQLARLGSLRSAMDEAYEAVHHAPTYLPLHTLMGDLLIQDGRIPDAIAKFTVVAHAYSVRGEVGQATKLLRRVIQLAPMDLSARTRLIDQLVARGQVDDAIKEYLELADIYYRLAELDMARKTYTTALRVVQQANADHAWNVHILQRMADIDMQRLDWKQALRVYEQIRTLQPDDQVTRKQLVELYLRMGQQPQARAELESYMGYLDSSAKAADSIPFLEDLIKDHEDELLFRRLLADRLNRLGRQDEAISQLDALGESLLQDGRKKEAVEVINQILLMNPPNAQDYRQLLEQIGI
ncbi:MAG: tetratricopeptide repeat protein [Chloroflexi bacterium]|nr:tetratricopeptide repeat protein [Chloroflexota bacterium]